MMSSPGGLNGKSTNLDRAYDDNGPTVVELIKQLQRGEISGKSLAIDDRRACVEYLTAEGYSSSEIAGILRVADRTVIRDRKAVRESNAIQRDESLVTETVGRLMQEAETAVSRLRRIARERSTPAAIKVDAERTCWHVLQGLVSSLQRLGYLPTAAKQVSAELTHTLRDERAPRYDEIEVEITRIEEAIGSGGAEMIAALPEESRNELARVREETKRLALGQRVSELAQGISNELSNQTEGGITDEHEQEAE